MKCPVCDCNHKKVEVAERCAASVDSMWRHYVILCWDLPDGVTKENLQEYKINTDNFDETKILKEKMEKYISTFN